MKLPSAAILAVAVAALPVSAPAQAQGRTGPDVSPLAIGETFTIHSRALGEARRINVFVPAGYAASSDSRLPVLYMPDGGIHEDFLHVAGLVQVSVGNGTMRPFLLVGIENTARRRDLTGRTDNVEDKSIAAEVGGSAAFRRFIRSELMPAVDARYRTTSESAIVGESLAGLFVVETFFVEPNLFDTYIAFDPSLWWNNGELVERAAERINVAAGRSLYVASSSQGRIAELARRLADVFAAHAPSNASWHYEPMPEESHAAIYHPAALRAFRRLFKPNSQPALSTAPEPGNPSPAALPRRAEPRIAFSSRRDGNWEIYLMDADGRRPTRLTTRSAQDRFPVWSPDGRRIVFGSERAGQWELWLMKSDGSHLTHLTTGIVAKGPRGWSPDGTQITFESDREGNREIYSIHADGTHLTRLTHNPAEDHDPRWSPDGTQIAFTSSRDGNREIYVMRADGSHPTRLSNHPAPDASPAWSPDGTRIAFTSSRDGNREIYLMDTLGKQLTRLTSDPAEDDLPLWSPDGARLAYQSVRGENYDIEVVQADGHRRTRLTTNPGHDGSFAWSPDGTRLAFISGRDGHDAVYVLRLGATTPIRLTTQPSLDPRWSP